MTEKLSNNEPQKLEAAMGQNVKQFAKQLIDRAKTDDVDVQGDFNGITLYVSAAEPGTVEDLVNFYSQESNRRVEEYRKSPEGKKAAEESEMLVITLQEKANSLMKQLDSIDFADLEAVIDWIVDIQEVSEYIGVSFDQQKVIDTFKSNGFDAGINTGDDFNKEDAENFAKYLVGQVLKGIGTYGVKSQNIHKFASEWKEKFGKKARMEQKQIDQIKERLQ
ncbi:hypothetical protein GF340_05910 [Candidatus Peregrinibacteria bacterium]|nr:hypothetical protein [Candidatus Peregrinibacteria bacterium]